MEIIPPEQQVETGPSPEEVARIKAAWYLSDDIVRAEKGLVSVHFPYLISSRETMKYIAQKDLVSARYHYEGGSGSGNFESEDKNIYEKILEVDKYYLDHLKVNNDEFLKVNSSNISLQKWESIEHEQMLDFFQNIKFIEESEKFNMDTPLFYSFILRADDKALSVLKAAHPEIKFAGTVYYDEPAVSILAIMEKNFEKMNIEPSNEELQTIILEEFRKSGIKK